MPEATIGVIGLGTLSQRMIRSTFNDQLEAAGDDGLRLVLPVTKDLFTDEIMAIADWAIKNDIRFEVVTDASADKLKVAEGYIADAVKEHRVKKDIGKKIVGLLDKADGRLFALWVEEAEADDPAYLAFCDADDAGVASYDLTKGLELLTFEDDLPEEEEDDEEPDDPEADLDPAAEMGRQSIPELKKLLKERGITLNRHGKGRISKPAYVSAIMQHDETGATVFMQNEEGTADPVEDDSYEAEAAQDAKDMKAEKAKAKKATADIEQAKAELEAEEAAEADEPFETTHEVDPETGEVDPVDIPDDDEEVEIPTEGGEIASSPVGPDPETGEPSVVVNVGGRNIRYTDVTARAFPTQRHELAGSCRECGGPIFTLVQGEAQPEVYWYHAEKCVLS